MSSAKIRSQIHQIVNSISPLDDLEKAHIHFVLNWIESGTEIFRTEKPATPETHLVAYFVVADVGLNKFLLVDHIKADLWLPPGGHVEIDEDPKETVKREAREELGIDAEFILGEPLFLTVTKTVGNIAKHTDVSLWYLLKGDPHQLINYDTSEFNQIRWFGINEIPFGKSDPHMKRFIDKSLLVLSNC